MNKMSATKRRYDAKKLAKTPSLKKKIALFLAREDYSSKKEDDIVDMLAFGLRPYVSYDEKLLLKKFDQSYNNKLEKLKTEEERLTSILNPAWVRTSIETSIATIKSQISVQDELMSEILEHSFSE